MVVDINICIKNKKRTVGGLVNKNDSRYKMEGNFFKQSCEMYTMKIKQNINKKQKLKIKK